VWFGEGDNFHEMKKWLKLSLWVVFIVLVGIQFIPVQRNEIEPVTIADFIELYEPPVHPYCSVYVQ
jgi:hypothetical protein